VPSGVFLQRPWSATRGLDAPTDAMDSSTSKSKAIPSKPKVITSNNQFLFFFEDHYEFRLVANAPLLGADTQSKKILDKNS
jgi:hypothetical protein